MSDAKYVYIMKIKGDVCRCKVGISNNPTLRQKYISEGLNKSVELLYFSKVRDAFFIEQFILKLFRPLKATMPKTSGHTEWLYLPSFIPFIFIFLYKWFMFCFAFLIATWGISEFLTH